MRPHRLLFATSVVAVALLGVAGPAPAIVYCNITQVEAKELRNGVQITISADGSLDYRAPRGGGGSWAQRIEIYFPGAKSTLERNFVDVGLFPVSYVQLSVPQGAVEGVGLSLSVALFTPSRYEVTRSTDQQTVIITVNSDRTIEQPGAGNGRRPQDQVAGEGTMTVEQADGLLTVYAVRADIHRLVARIARECDLTVLVDDQVQRETTISLEALPPIEVMRAIAAAYGLALLERDHKFMISEGVPTDLATYNMSGTQSFPMEYVRAYTASGLLPTFLYSYLHVNPEQNAVVVTAPRQMLGKIERDLHKIDVAPEQIMIEAIAVEYASTTDAEESLSFARLGHDQGASVDTVTGETRYEAWDPDDNTAEGAASQWILVGRMPHDFDAQLNALAAKGRADVKARPRLVTLNGRGAEFFVGSQRFIIVQYVRYGNTQERIQAVDVGVKLNITAWTGGNQEITTTVSSVVSNIQELDPQSGLPLLSQREASTTVRARNGETIVLGGLIQEQQYVTKRKIPILGDLPIIGFLFRSRDVTTTNSELVILITPHLLTADGRLQDEAAEQAIREQFLGEGVDTAVYEHQASQ